VKGLSRGVRQLESTALPSGNDSWNKKVSRLPDEREMPVKNLEGKVQVKICGLTRAEEALACAQLGAHAIGCVFYPKSPRFVEDGVAQKIFGVLPEDVGRVGVFVNEDFSGVMRRVSLCGINFAQLHGNESPQLINRLQERGVKVIKTLFVNAEPNLKGTHLYDPAAFLVEASGGSLPGGNALPWDWAMVKKADRKRPILLAGGLNSDNVATAMAQALPDGVDVSSGVEKEPGKKDLEKVKGFIEAAFALRRPGHLKRIF